MNGLPEFQERRFLIGAVNPEELGKAIKNIIELIEVLFSINDIFRLLVIGEILPVLLSDKLPYLAA